MARKNTFRNKIDNEQTAALPAAEFKGEIRVVEHDRDVAEACKYLERFPVLGFDTETRPSFRPGVMFRVSLLQLSAPDVCYLFRLNKIRFDKAIIRLLESKQTLKIGAAVSGDLHALHQIKHFREAGFVDLQQLAPDWGIEEKSLRKLSVSFG